MTSQSYQSGSMVQLVQVLHLHFRSGWYTGSRTQVVQVVYVIHVVQVVQVIQVVRVVRMINLYDMNSENIWFSGSKPSNHQEKLRCQCCDGRGTNGVRNEIEQYTG